MSVKTPTSYVADQIEAFASDIIKITVGPCGKIFYVHAKYLSKSDVFRARANGKWKDSHDKTLDLKEWDQETVCMFLQWLYSGKYAWTPPQWTSVNQWASVIVCDGKGVGDKDDLNRRTGDSEQEVAEHVEGEDGPCFIPSTLLKYPGGATENSFDLAIDDSWTEDYKGFECVLDYEAALMANAKTYALADYMMVPGLKAYAFERIQWLLGWIGPLVSGTLMISNLVTTVKYICAIRDQPLQRLMVTYMAENFAILGGEYEIQKLMGEEVDLMLEVCRVTCLRMKSWEKVMTDLREKLEAANQDIEDRTVSETS